MEKDCGRTFAAVVETLKTHSSTAQAKPPSRLFRGGARHEKTVYVPCFIAAAWRRPSSFPPPQDGFLYLDKEKFHASFAGDVSDEEAAFMADSQVPWGVDALGGTISEPAWRNKPSWYLVATEDRMIPPPAQRQMSERAGSTVVEAEGSHAIYVSKPDLVADLIERAASEVGSATR
jgi:pimeloyl-ACP methyl ester carboxylesterase